MKFEIRDVLLSVVIILLGFNYFKTSDKEIIVQPTTITVPDKSGTVYKEITPFRPVLVYLPQTTDKIIVDEEYKRKYEIASDSIEKLSLYLKAIEIKDQRLTLVDNDTLNVTGDFKTRGEILDYDLKWKVKSFEHSYIPEIIYKQPKLSFVTGFEMNLPTKDNNVSFKLDVGIINSKGLGFKVGADTDQRVWLGISKQFTLIK